MKIGYACIPLLTSSKTTRKILLKNFNYETFKEKTYKNLIDLLKILKINNENNIKLFRISSDIIPFGSHSINTFDFTYEFSNILNQIGEFIKENNMRVSMHPGQYTVINSPSYDVLKNSINDLLYHANFLDSLSLDWTHKIVLHIGGVYSNKDESTKRFIDNFNLLPINVKKRLVIENDEKNYSILDVLRISDKISIPVIFDNLHNECHNDNALSLDEILSMVEKTWKKDDGPIKVHYSQQDKTKKIGSHSKTINLNYFSKYIESTIKYNPDIMLEVKDKNISAIKCINFTKELLEGYTDLNLLQKEISNYELYIKSYGLDLYNDFLTDIKNNMTFKTLYSYVDMLSNKEPLKEANKLIQMRTFNSLNAITSQKEKNHFNKLISNDNLDKSKEYFFKLITRYEDYDICKNLLKSYYFYY